MSNKTLKLYELNTNKPIQVDREKIHTVAGYGKGSVVTTVQDGKISGTYYVYESPTRIRHMMMQ